MKIEAPDSHRFENQVAWNGFLYNFKTLFVIITFWLFVLKGNVHLIVLAQWNVSLLK